MDIEWLIYHLIHNDDEHFNSIEDLDIDLVRSDLDQWERLLVGFARNRTLTYVHLSRGFQRPVVTEDDLQDLFSALRQLPKLSKVKLDSFTTFDLEQTESLFLNNNTIEDVWIENAQCYYEDDEEEILDEGEIADNNYNRYELFLGYLSSMSSNRLRRLRIEVPEKLSHGANITPLLNPSSKLTTLVIETTEVSPPRVSPSEEDRHRKFATAMATLRSNSVLKVLDMDFCISFTDFKHVATMLTHNKTLTHLSLRFETTAPESIFSVKNGTNHVREYNPHFIESIQLFLETLRRSTDSALTHFFQYNVDDRNLRSAVEQSLEISANCRNDTSKVQDLIDLGFDMLQFNLSLIQFQFFLFDRKNLVIEKDDHDLRVATQKKEMYLRLNAYGRRLVQHRDIFESVPKSLWVDQLFKHSMLDDLDGIYYYISTNPLICRIVKEGPTRSTLEETDRSTGRGENKNKKGRTSSTTSSSREKENASAKQNHPKKKTMRGALSCSQTDDTEVGVETKRQRVHDATGQLSLAPEPEW